MGGRSSASQAGRGGIQAVSSLTIVELVGGIGSSDGRAALVAEGG